MPEVEVEAAAAMAAAVAPIKLPPFYHNNPKMWFTQVEYILASRQISSEAARKIHLMANIDETLIGTLGTNYYAAGNMTYSQIKAAILSATMPTTDVAMQKILDMELGESTATQLLSKFAALMDFDNADKCIRSLLAKKLPKDVRFRMTGIETGLDEYAREADKYIVAHKAIAMSNPQRINWTGKTPNSQRGSFVRSRPPAHLMGQQRSQSFAGRASQSQGTWCANHKKYGKETKYCKPPCAYKKEGVPPRRFASTNLVQQEEEQPDTSEEPTEEDYPRLDGAAEDDSEEEVFEEPGWYYHHTGHVHTMAAFSQCPYLTLLDRLSGRTIIIDTGSALSLWPADDIVDVPGPDKTLQLIGAGGARISTHGKRRMQVHFDGVEDAQIIEFVIAAVSMPLLGMDYLTEMGFTINARDKTIEYDDADNDEHRIELAAQAVYHVGAEQQADNDREKRFRGVLDEFPTVMDVSTPFEPAPPTGVRHFISTEGPPTKAKVRPMKPELQKIAKEMFDKWLDAGIVRRSSSPYASPIHMVLKSLPDLYRCVGDFRALNANTKKDAHPLPFLNDFSANLAGMNIFSKLDLFNAFFHIPMNEDDIEKTAVCTPFGSFEFLRMPFGLANAAQTFQRYMTELFADMPCVFVYVDDLLIASSSPEQHEQDLRQVLGRLEEAGLRVRADKVQLAKETMPFLGHEVSAAGVKPDAERVRQLRTWSLPETVGDLSRFVGLATFYSRFVKNFAHHCAPLHAMLRPAPNAKTGSKAVKNSKIPVAWNAQAKQSFENLKNAIADAALLAHPLQSAPLRLTTDASDFAIGGVVEQSNGSQWMPIAFYSRKLKGPELNYSATDRELYAIYLSLRKFRHLLGLSSFFVRTDHKPLLAMFKRKDHIARVTRWIVYISIMTRDIRHLSGDDNVVADLLSRPSANAFDTHDDDTPSGMIPTDTVFAVQSVTLLQSIADKQRDDPDLTAEVLPRYAKRVNLSGVSVICDTRLGDRLRPLVPQDMADDVIKRMHALSHPGTKATRKLVASRYCIPNLSKKVVEIIRHCAACQKGKIIRHNKPPHSPFQAPNARFATVHIDVTGPFEAHDGYRYILTMIDRTTRWPEAMPMKDITTSSIARAFIQSWIQRFGVPDTLVSDQGAQFTSAVWSELCGMLGVTHKLTTPYHPACNGLVERLHRHMKEALKCRLSDATNWVNELPIVMLGIRSAIKEDLGASSMQLTLGHDVRLPAATFGSDRNLPYVHDLTKEYCSTLAHSRPSPTTTPLAAPYQPTATPFVYLRAPPIKKGLATPYTGPFRVVRRGRRTITILRSGKEVTVSEENVKPAWLDEPARTPWDKTPVRPADTQRPSAPALDSRHARRPEQTRPPDPTPATRLPSPRASDQSNESRHTDRSLHPSTSRPRSPTSSSTSPTRKTQTIASSSQSKSDSRARPPAGPATARKLAPSRSGRVRKVPRALEEFQLYLIQSANLTHQHGMIMTPTGPSYVPTSNNIRRALNKLSHV